MESTEDQVTRLLAGSMAAHQRALLARSQQRTGDARTALTEARDLRVQAHTLDPTHQCRAWLDEQPRTGPRHDTHQAMLAFYAAQLGD